MFMCEEVSECMIYQVVQAVKKGPAGSTVCAGGHYLSVHYGENYRTLDSDPPPFDP